jgi:phosphatidylserine decarboxylase
VSWRALRQTPRYLLGMACLELALAVAGVRSRGRLLAGSAAALLFFFRDPERRLEPEEGVAYAPADGTVVKVDQVRDPWVPGEDSTRITTFLALHNVHVTRSPVAGRIAGEESMDGGYRPAFLPRAEANHRRRLAIDGRRGRVVVVQVAGLVARKITSWVSPGDDLRPGQRLGVIHFGSRADVLLPAGSAEVLVSAGDRVRAGQSPLARYRELAA